MTTTRGRRTAARAAAGDGRSAEPVSPSGAAEPAVPPAAAPFAWLAEAAACWLPNPVADARTQPGAELGNAPGLARDAVEYWVDACQRSVLFCDMLRKRANLALEHYRKGKPPVLVFDYA